MQGYPRGALYHREHEHGKWDCTSMAECLWWVSLLLSTCYTVAITLLRGASYMSVQLTDEFISAHGLQFHYRRWSSPVPDPKNPPVFLLHGLASAARIWDFVAPLLAERDYIVTALDQRGHGESDKPENGYDFATIIADDATVAQELGIAHPIIVGHS